jgi:hypothetical protein
MYRSDEYGHMVTCFLPQSTSRCLHCASGHSVRTAHAGSRLSDILLDPAVLQPPCLLWSYDLSTQDGSYKRDAD